MDLLNYQPGEHEASKMSEQHCPNCKRPTPTFQQVFSTMPQDERNLVRKYRETFCALCGTCVDRQTEDEQPTQG